MYCTELRSHFLPFVLETVCQNLLASHWMPSVDTTSNTSQIKFLRTPLVFVTSTGIASGSLRSAHLVESPTMGESLRAADSSLKWKLAEEHEKGSWE